jgi:mannose-6-phosphate isomerase-like protein (cupin superfamily)
MTAVLLDPGAGRVIGVGPDHMVHKATSETDAFSLVEYVAPGGGGPPLHVHHANEEAFFVLDGEVDFTCEGTTRRLVAGGFAFVPRGAKHTFFVPSGRPARWVGVFAPGHYLALVEDLGKLLAAGAPDGAALAALFARYDTEMVA